MEGTFKPPRALTFDQDVHVNLDNFLRSFDIYLKATGLDSKDEETKIAIFLNHAGEEAQRKFLTFSLTVAERKNYKSVVDAFKSYCRPLRNETYDRYKFFTRVQGEGESIDHFITEIKVLASICNFKDLEDSLIRDRIVSGIRDLSIQERLLQQEKLTAKKAEDLCRAAEISHQQVKDLRNGTTVIDTIRLRKSIGSIGNNVKQVSGSMSYNCLKCGRFHARQQCPAFGKICTRCNKPNHFAVGCKLRYNNNNNQPNSSNNSRSPGNTANKNNRTFNRNNKRNVHELNSEAVFPVDESNLPFIDDIVLDSVLIRNDNMWTVEASINNKVVKFKIDTGANCNCMPVELFHSLDLPNELINDNRVTLVAYGNNKIESEGSVVITCAVKGVRYNIKFILVKGTVIPILGLNASIKLNLIKKVDTLKSIKASEEESKLEKQTFINNNKDIFSGTGKIPFQYKIVLKQDAIPFVSACRRVPDTIKPRLKSALDDLVQRDIIKVVEQPTEWVNNIVIVEKSDKSLRICLDPLHLNNNIVGDHFPIPTLEELSLKLKGKKYFTVLDLKEGFYHVPLEEECMLYTTFITPFGKFCFKRLPFGLNVSPEVFQRVNEKVFGNLGIGIYFDDFIIAGETTEIHDQILMNVVDRARQFNVKFNMNKLQYKVNEVKYVGQIFSETGVKPDPKYIEAIVNLENPNNKKELLRILGMLNYIMKFVPSLSQILNPLRQLVKNNVPWQWTVDHSKCFSKIKNFITKTPQLKIFDSKLPIEIQTDASQFGIGGCLLQQGQPVVFCSRSLTETEQNYPQIDKELLGICFALKKFHNFVYGRKIIIKTDHKPLVSICSKDFFKVSGRLQKLKLRLIDYNFTVEYLPGKLMFIADLLSRSFLKNDNSVKSEPVVVHTLELDIPLSTGKLQTLIEATKVDSVLNRIKEFCKTSWPNKLNNFEHQELSTYFKIKSNIFVKNELIYVGHKLVVPHKIRNSILNDLHIAHLGIEKTKSRARQIFFWPGMSKDIESFISKCKVCSKFARKPTKETLIPHDRPHIPFHKVGVDILHYATNDYLVLVDYYSNWIELLQLESKTASEVINKLKSLFCRFGTPLTIISDNNPFNSLEFKEFAKNWDFNHITSSPRYPKSNGLAERAVGICKTLLRKCQEANTDIFRALLEYRNTPLTGLMVSPAELLQNRLLRSSLPVSNYLLNTKPCIDNDTIQNKRRVNKKYYDRNAFVRREFSKGDSVMIRNNFEKCWVPGEIVDVSDTPRSYFVRDNRGRVLRRNSSFLRHTPVPFALEPGQNIYDNEPVESSSSTFNENVTDNIPDSGQSATKSDGVMTTSSGRVVKKPVRYRD